VEVADFDSKLNAAIREIDRQCTEVDKKIGLAERALGKSDPAKRENRLELLKGMRADIVKVRGSQSELEAFQKSFRTLSKGRKAIVVGPHLPHHDLFLSLAGVQARTGEAVASFNAKIDAFNKL
jgi:hypothetical protein